MRGKGKKRARWFFCLIVVWFYENGVQANSRNYFRQDFDKMEKKRNEGKEYRKLPSARGGSGCDGGATTGVAMVESIFKWVQLPCNFMVYQSISTSEFEWGLKEGQTEKQIMKELGVRDNRQGRENMLRQRAVSYEIGMGLMLARRATDTIFMQKTGWWGVLVSM